MPYKELIYRSDFKIVYMKPWNFQLGKVENNLRHIVYERIFYSYILAANIFIGT